MTPVHAVQSVQVSQTETDGATSRRSLPGTPVPPPPPPPAAAGEGNAGGSTAPEAPPGAGGCQVEDSWALTRAAAAGNNPLH